MKGSLWSVTVFKESSYSECFWNIVHLLNSCPEYTFIFVGPCWHLLSIARLKVSHNMMFDNISFVPTDLIQNFYFSMVC